MKSLVLFIIQQAKVDIRQLLTLLWEGPPTQREGINFIDIPLRPINLSTSNQITPNNASDQSKESKICSRKNLNTRKALSKKTITRIKTLFPSKTRKPSNHISKCSMNSSRWRLEERFCRSKRLSSQQFNNNTKLILAWWCKTKSNTITRGLPLI